MNLGFYYHIPISSSSGELKIPGYLGVFLDSLASEVRQLILFMHEANDFEASQCDYVLQAKNISYVSLGHKTPAWDRFLWPGKTLRRIRLRVGDCDVILVRAPSPLAPMFYKAFKNLTEIVYLVVGDYANGVKFIHQPLLRKLPIQILNIQNDHQLRMVLKKTLALVNSQELYDKYKSFALDLRIVRTTTITDKDFFYRADTCMNDEINILYTGRLDITKGLRELLNAVCILVKEHFNLNLHFAAWEDNPAKPVEKLLSEIARTNQISDRIFFHGKKALGKELNAVYRSADIYVIPSYHEGFPRTIWEAMANGLPVIASNVGSIPSFVGDSAILIRPHNVTDLTDALKRVMNDNSLRKRLIASGYERAKQNTLGTSVKEIGNVLKQKYVDSPMQLS